MVVKNSMNMFFLLSCMLMVLLGSNIITVESEIQCSSVLQPLLPCKGFMLGFADQPSGECCGNLQGLDNQAKGSVDDRRGICECFKQGLKLFPADPEKIKKLHDTCQLSPALPNDPNVDCNSI